MFTLLRNHQVLFDMHTLLYLFLAVLGLRCCAQVFSSCGDRGQSLEAAHGLLTAAASPAAERRL